MNTFILPQNKYIHFPLYGAINRIGFCLKLFILTLPNYEICQKGFQLSRRVFINYKKIVCTLPARKKTWNPKHSSEVQGKKQNHFTYFVDPLGSWLLYPYSVCEFSMPIWASLILITISPIWTLFLATESRVQRFSGHHTTAASSDAYNLSGLLQLHVL